MLYGVLSFRLTDIWKLMHQMVKLAMKKLFYIMFDKKAKKPVSQQCRPYLNSKKFITPKAKLWGNLR